MLPLEAYFSAISIAARIHSLPRLARAPVGMAAQRLHRCLQRHDLVVKAFNCLQPSFRSRRIVSTSSGNTTSLAFCRHIITYSCPTARFTASKDVQTTICDARVRKDAYVPLTAWTLLEIARVLRSVRV